MGTVGGKRVRSHNIVFATIFLSLSSITGIHTYFNMPLGTASNMGPGFFPLMLSIMLAILSILVGFRATPSNVRSLRFAPPKAIILIVGTPMLFGLTVQPLGLVIAVAVTVFFSSLAGRMCNVGQAALFAAGFTFFCMIVFGVLLKLPIPLWGSLW